MRLLVCKVVSLLVSDGVEIAEEGHLAAHGLTGRELAVDPEVTLVEVGLLTGPGGGLDAVLDRPFGIAVLQDDAGVAAVVSGRPGLGAVEGRLSGMALGIAVVAARGVAVGDVTLSETSHLDDVAGITAEAPAGLREHNVLQLALAGLVGDVMGEHNELEVLRHLPAAVVGAAARGALGHMGDVIVLGLAIDARLEVVIKLGIVARLGTGEIGRCGPDLAVGHDVLVLGMHNADTEKAVVALAEDGRLGTLDLRLLGEDVLPLSVAGDVVEEGGGHLTEVTAAHLHRTDVLQVVELRPSLFVGIAEGLDGLGGVVALERIGRVVDLPLAVLHQTEGLGGDGAVGGIGPGGHRGAAGLIHNSPVEVGVGNTLGVALAVADGEEEVHLVAGLVDNVGDAVAALTDAEVVVGESAAGKDVGQQHVVDVADVGDMTVPVEGIGVTAAHVNIDGVAGQPVLPETGSHSGLEVGLVPHVGMKVGPFLHEGVEVGLIDGEALGIGLRDELWLTGHGPHVVGILGLAKAHIVVAAHGIAEGLVIDISGDVEVHRAAYILDDETVAAGDSATEVGIPHIGADEVFLACLLIGIGCFLPELHHTGTLFLLRVDIIEPDLTTYPRGVVALATVAEPLVEVGGMQLLGGHIADDVDVDGLGGGVPDVVADAGGVTVVGTDAVGDVDGVGAALPHRLWQLEEEPVVTFAGEGMVGVHRLRLAPDVEGLDGEVPVVFGGDAPDVGLLCLSGLEPFAKDEQRVVALGEGVAEIGAGACAVVTVVYLTVAEVQHKVVFVDDTEADDLGGHNGE